VQDTRRDLAFYFVWKQVRLGFLSLSSRLVDARLRVMHVALSWRSCGVEAEDRQINATNCIRPFYPKITVFIVLDLKSIVVFYLDV
jgi:hypothetical protein